MARDLFQLQIGNQVHQVENVDYNPTFDGKKLAAVLATANAGAGYCIPFLEMNYTNPTVGSYLEMRPDYLSMRWLTDTAKDQFVYLTLWSNWGPSFALYNYQAAPTNNYAYFYALCQHYDYVNKVWRKAFVRLTECALIIHNVEIEPDTYVTTNHLNLWWDDTAKALKGKDSGGTTYTWSHD